MPRPPRDPSVPKKRFGTGSKGGPTKVSAAQRRNIFALAYIANGGRAHAAAIEAGYSEGVARTNTTRMLNHPEVAKILSAHASKLARKYELRADLVVRSIVQELTFDPANLYRPDGSLKDITELDEDTRMALTSVEFESVGGKDAPTSVRKVKWANRERAREQAMKHLGMFAADNEQKTRIGLENLERDVLVELRDRVAKMLGKHPEHRTVQ